MKFEVVLSRRAKSDLYQIVSWIKARSRTGASNWLNALESNLQQLAENPTSNSLATEAEDLGIDLRQHLFKTRRGHAYRLLFTIGETKINVLAIRGAGQNLIQQIDTGFDDEAG